MAKKQKDYLTSLLADDGSDGSATPLDGEEDVASFARRKSVV